MNDETKNAVLSQLALGKKTDYRDSYTPELLQAVPRSLNRQELGVEYNPLFYGCDVWHAYELSWLNDKGKPQVALARIIVPAHSPNIVESKSLKLYFNSFNQTKITSQNDLQKMILNDISGVTGSPIKFELIQASEHAVLNSVALPGECIDDLDVEIKSYSPDPGLLSLVGQEGVVNESLHSHLLKSNCLITNQPDWASVVIEYEGKQIDRESMLRYLVGFRQHNEFHEQCVERIFMDISRRCKPKKLSVHAIYTRRGGIDINPFRTTEKEFIVPFNRINRQ